MSIKNGDMPAMPQPSEWTGSKGLTKREQFAAMAMQGLLSNSVMGDSDLHNNASDWKKDMVESATEFADALLAQLEEKGE